MSREYFVCLLLIEEEAVATGGDWPDSKLTMPVSASVVKQIIKCSGRNLRGIYCNTGLCNFKFKLAHGY